MRRISFVASLYIGLFFGGITGVGITFLGMYRVDAFLLSFGMGIGCSLGVLFGGLIHSWSGDIHKEDEC